MESEAEGQAAPATDGSPTESAAEPVASPESVEGAPRAASPESESPREADIPTAPETAAPPAPATPPISLVIDVSDLDWGAVRAAVSAARDRAHLRDTVERMETWLDRAPGVGLLFDGDRRDAADRVIRIAAMSDDAPLWFIGDIHGDLLALEAALAHIGRSTTSEVAPRIVFLGDFFDDGGYGLEVLLRLFHLILDAPATVAMVLGNHDEALQYSGARFTAAVRPSDFSDFLNEKLAHEWITRAGKVAVRLFDVAPHALFLPDGLLATHGGFPLVDLHGALRETGDWNDPRCLSDFTWTRAHPRARRKMPNRTTRGSQFGYEDFDAFCVLTVELGTPVTHMVRGHDHVDDRYEIYAAYVAHPVLTTVALSRRLPRESFGPYERVPTIARWVPGALPEVHRLHVPPELVRELYPEEVEPTEPEPGTSSEAASR